MNERLQVKTKPECLGIWAMELKTIFRSIFVDLRE